MLQAQNVFREKNVIVRPAGVQGPLYKSGSYLQLVVGSYKLTPNIVVMAKLAEVNGLQILKVQPFLAVAILTTGAVFFYRCVAIVMENIAEKRN
jgi:hypothetical protein